MPVVVLIEGVEANNGAIRDLTGIPRQVSVREEVVCCYKRGASKSRGCTAVRWKALLLCLVASLGSVVVVRFPVKLGRGSFVTSQASPGR